MTRTVKYVSGWCGTADCHGCAGRYPNGSRAEQRETECVCRCHTDGQAKLVDIS